MMRKGDETDQIGRLVKLTAANREVVVVWLYGSQAKGNAGPNSEWDLAVAFNPVKLADPLDNRLRPELRALDWQRALGLVEGQISVVDINPEIIRSVIGQGL